MLLGQVPGSWSLQVVECTEDSLTAAHLSHLPPEVSIFVTNTQFCPYGEAQYVERMFSGQLNVPFRIVSANTPP